MMAARCALHCKVNICTHRVRVFAMNDTAYRGHLEQVPVQKQQKQQNRFSCKWRVPASGVGLDVRAQTGAAISGGEGRSAHPEVSNDSPSITSQASTRYLCDEKGTNPLSMRILDRRPCVDVRFLRVPGVGGNVPLSGRQRGRRACHRLR